MAVDPRRAEEGLAELIALYRDAERIIAADVKEAIRDERIAQRAFRILAFRRVQEELRRLGVEGDRLAERLIENAWREGDKSILDAIPSGDGTYTFSQINRGALEEMQAALVGRLGDARGTVGRQVNDVFARAGRRSVTLGLLGAEGSPRRVASNLVEQIRRQGVKAFVDRGGNRWDLQRYAEMVARTTTREAVVQAQIERMGEQGIEYARISTSSRPCPICAQWQGVLVTLGGKSSSLNGEPATTLDALPNGGPPFHPNCRHYLMPEAVDFNESAGPPAKKPSNPPRGGDDGWNDRVEIDRGHPPDSRSDIKRGIRAVAKVHDPKGIPRMRVQVEGDPGYGGWFRRGTNQMAINPSWRDRAFAMVHETGHAFDYYSVGSGRIGVNSIKDFASEGSGNPWAAIVDAAMDTDSIKTIKQIRDGLPVGNGFRAHANYLLRRREIFARAYTQYVARRAGDQEILKSVRSRTDGSSLDGFSQWRDDEFAPLEALFDKAFGV